MSLEPGTLLAWITGLSGVVVGLWTQLGKSRDASFTRLEGERNRLDKRVEALEARLDQVESELAQLRADHRTLLDFLRDITTGYFDTLEEVVERARELLARMGGGGKS